MDIKSVLSYEKFDLVLNDINVEFSAYDHNAGVTFHKCSEDDFEVEVKGKIAIIRTKSKIESSAPKRRFSLFKGNDKAYKRKVIINAPNVDYLRVNAVDANVDIQEVELKKCEVNIDTGSIYIHDLFCKRLDSTVNSGYLKVENIRDLDYFNLYVKSGSVKLIDFKASQAHISVDTGSVKGNGFHADTEFTADCNSGVLHLGDVLQEGAGYEITSKDSVLSVEGKKSYISESKVIKIGRPEYVICANTSKIHIN